MAFGMTVKCNARCIRTPLHALCRGHRGEEAAEQVLGGDLGLTNYTTGRRRGNRPLKERFVDDGSPRQSESQWHGSHACKHRCLQISGRSTLQGRCWGVGSVRMLPSGLLSAGWTRSGDRESSEGEGRGMWVEGGAERERIEDMTKQTCQPSCLPRSSRCPPSRRFSSRSPSPGQPPSSARLNHPSDGTHCLPSRATARFRQKIQGAPQGDRRIGDSPRPGGRGPADQGRWPFGAPWPFGLRIRCSL